MGPDQVDDDAAQSLDVLPQGGFGEEEEAFRLTQPFVVVGLRRSQAQDGATSANALEENPEGAQGAALSGVEPVQLGSSSLCDLDHLRVLSPGGPRP